MEDNRSGTLPTAAEFAAAQYADASFRESPVQLADGSYFSKYELVAYERDTTTVGLFGTDAANAYGAFFVNPTHEADTGGAHRQELTVHPTTYGPIVLGMLHGRHYGAPGIALTLNQTRVFAPHYMAFNYGPAATTTLEGLRAKAEAMVPGLTGGNNAFYKTVMAALSDTLSYLPFEPASRGRFQGRLISHRNTSLSNATVILSDPDTDSQLKNRGYQYSTRTDADGSFDLPNLHPGTYRLTIQQDGDYGEFRIENVVITANATIGGAASAANAWVVTAEGLRRYTDYAVVMPGSFSYGGSNYGDFGTGRVTVASGLPTALMRQALAAGRGAGAWTGTAGITSTAAATAIAASSPRTIGWLDNGDGSVTFAFAAAGDTNLDWTVDVLDAAAFLATALFDAGPYNATVSAVASVSNALSSANIAMLAAAVTTDRPPARKPAVRAPAW